MREINRLSRRDAIGRGVCGASGGAWSPSKVDTGNTGALCHLRWHASLIYCYEGVVVQHRVV